MNWYKICPLILPHLWILCFILRLLEALSLDSVEDFDTFLFRCLTLFFRCHQNLLKYCLMYIIIQIGNCVLRGPKTTHRLSDSLGVLTELSKTVAFMVLVYSAENVQIKINRKGTQDQVQQRPGTNSQLSSPSGRIRTALNSSRNDLWQCAQCIASQGSSPQPWCPDCLSRVHYVGLANLSSSAPPEVMLIPCGSRSPL